MYSEIRGDAKRYISGATKVERFKSRLHLLFTQEFLAIAIYRYGKSIQNIRFPLIGLLARLVYFFANKFIAEICAGVLLDLGSEIGEGLLIGHFGGVYIKARIGKNCTVGQQVVIGHKGGFRGGGVPSIGNNVYIGVGAKVLGDVVVGDNVIIGANAVVISDLPSNSTAVGVPAKVIKMNQARCCI